MSPHFSRVSSANLSRDQERALVLSWQHGNRSAGEFLARAFMPFVVSIALEYRRWNTNLDDVIQQGCLGLLHAVKRFDPKRNTRLTTYAAYWIRSEIRDFVVRHHRIVRIGTTKNERRALRYQRTSLQCDPVSLASASGLSLRQATLLLPLLVSRDVSLDQTVDMTFALQERLPSKEPSPEQQTIGHLDGSTLNESVRRALAELSPREQLIAQERWLSDQPTSLTVLGAKLGVTKERVRQIEQRTRRKVQARLAHLLA